MAHSSDIPFNFSLSSSVALSLSLSSEIPLISLCFHSSCCHSFLPSVSPRALFAFFLSFPLCSLCFFRSFLLCEMYTFEIRVALLKKAMKSQCISINVVAKAVLKKSGQQHNNDTSNNQQCENAISQQRLISLFFASLLNCMTHVFRHIFMSLST